MLVSKMQSVTPREIGGSVGQKGHDYQNHWTICLLLKLHDAPDDYAILVEHWDDVVSLDAPHDPEAISFFQVKDKQRLSVTDVLRYNPKKNGHASIVGKLHALYEDFGEHVEGCYLVTSRPVTNSKGKKIVSGDGWLCLNEVDGCDEIAQRIHKETGRKCDRFGYVFRFMNSELSSKGYANHIKGIIYDFFKSKYKCDIDVDAFYNTILQDIAQKGAIILNDFDNVGELVSKKGFKRVQIEKFISEIISRTKHHDVVKLADQLLTECGHDLGEKFAIMKNVNAYQSEKMQYTNDIIFELESDIVAGVEAEILEGGTVDAIAQRVHEGLDPSTGYMKLYSEEFIKGAIYYESAKTYGKLQTLG